MIETYDPASEFVQTAVRGLVAMDVASSVQLTVARTTNGLYHVELGRMCVAPTRLEGLSLGYVSDVPPGQRRATWLLTDAVNLALTNPEAHSLLHW